MVDLYRDARASERLLEVLGLEVAVLVVAEGLLEGNGRGVEDACALLEDVVHFLERAVAGFGEEEVHDGEDEGVAGWC